MRRHHALVHRVVRYPGGGTHGYFAHCDTCEWTGKIRKSSASAALDAERHDTNENKEIE